MKLIKLLIGGLIAMLFISCEKNEVQENLPKLEIDEELIDFFVHEEGTKYIMVDTAKNFVDTVVVTNVRYFKSEFVEDGKGGKPVYGDYYNPSYRVDYTSYYSNNFATELGTSKDEEYTYNFLMILNKDYAGHTTIDLKKEGNWNLSQELVTKKDSLIALGTTYYDILNIEYEGSSFEVFTFAKGVGLILKKSREGKFLLKEKIEP